MPLKITNLRKIIIHICLAIMEMVWLTPLVMLVYPPAWTWQSVRVWLGLSALLLTWMLILDILNRVIPSSPGYELAVLGSITVSTLLLVAAWPWLDSAAPAGGIDRLFSWLAHLNRRLPGEVFLILFNLYLWQRASSATSRDLSFFSVGLSFRLGILWLLSGGAVFSLFSGQDILWLLWAYAAFSLPAMALARIDEKAAGAGSSGTALPLPRLLQLGAIIAVTIGGAAWLSTLLAPATLQTLWGWLEPVWVIVLLGLVIVIRVIFWLLEPVLAQLGPTLAEMFSRLNEQIQQFSQALGSENTAVQPPQLLQAAPPWVWLAFRWMGLAIVLLLALGFIYLFLERLRRDRLIRQSEAAAPEVITLGGGLANRLLAQLHGLRRLTRKYGFGRSLLAAISVENIYANVCRLARQKGFPRPPAQPPDLYLNTLTLAFPERQAALQRLTAAYMQVHYGDQPVSGNELTQLKKDYERIRQSSPG